jgi:hypothetical protein
MGTRYLVVFALCFTVVAALVYRHRLPPESIAGMVAVLLAWLAPPPRLRPPCRRKDEDKPL